MRTSRSRAGAFTAGRGWRKTIGQRKSESGDLIPYRVWLGHDEGQASIAALKLGALWLGLGSPYWTVEGLEQARQILNGGLVQPTETIEREPSKPKGQRVKGLTMGDVLTAYKDTQLKNPRLSESSKRSIACRIGYLRKSPFYHDPIATIDSDKLSKIVGYWLGLPKGVRGKPIGGVFASMIIKMLMAALNWADMLNLWTMPHRFNDLFRIPRNFKPSPKVKTFTLEELKAIYSCSDDRLRCFALLALNCGFANMEIGTLRKSEIDLEQGIIKRDRVKTGVAGQWDLWAETIDAIKGQIDKGNSEYAFTTRFGSPLVSFTKVHARKDMISRQWFRQIQKRKISALSFKYLRKTAATMIRAIGGIEVSEQFLAHAENGIARFDSVPSPQRLKDALSQLHEQLAPVLALAHADVREAA